MPYSLRGDCVYKGDKKLKCYDNHADALAYFRALQANVKDSIHFSSMYISKSSLSNGVMKWSAVNSDTEWDLYGERMTLELYNKMLDYIKLEVPPPDSFKSLVCSDYWCGGMPYLSLSHYPDLNGTAVPGEPLDLFIDGKQLKARGILFDNSLGKAVWNSLKNDEIKTKSSSDDDRIRISIAFLDLAHKHGTGDTFKRNSLDDVCQECRKGVGNKIYLDGYLVHLALTRVPVNPRTIIEPEDIMTAKSNIQTRKEDAISIVGEENSELIEQIDKSALEAKSDVLVEMSETETPLVEDGKTNKGEQSDEDLEKDVIPPEDEVVGEERAKKKLAKKSEIVVEDAKRSWKETTKEHMTETTEDDGSDDNSEDMPMDKKKKKMAKKSLIEEVVETKKSVLDIATDGLYNSVNDALNMQGVTLEQRLESINPALQEMGNAITAFVRESMGAVAPVPASNENGQILEAVAILTESVKSLSAEVATLKAQTSVPSNVVVPNRVPVPRSIPAQTVAQTQKSVNPNSVTNIVRRSVSTDLPMV